MPNRPSLQTPRLLLRPFAPEDAPAVTRLAGDREIASNTATVPHPYEQEMADAWIAGQEEAFDEGRSVIFAVVERASNELVGTVALVIGAGQERAELGYWVGRPYWGKGYCTEAAREVVRFAFEELGMHRVYAHHFTRNAASGRVMQKLGMRHEGHLRGHVLKWGVHEDIEVYGILAAEWEAPAPIGTGAAG